MSEISVIEKVKPLADVYFFGECFFQNIQKIKNSNLSELFTLNNMSCGNGSCFDFLCYLRSKPKLNRGVFLLGGTSHDRNGWGNGETLNEIKNWFGTYLYDSILVLCLTGPRNPRPEHLIYNYEVYNEEKIKASNNKNIFYLDLRFDTLDPRITKDDGVHLTNEGRVVLESKIAEYLLNNRFFSEKLCIDVKKTIKQIEIKEDYKRIYIIHGHNNSYFSVFNNEVCVKKYAILGCSKLKEQGYNPYQDRMIIDKIANPKLGNIQFSDPLYVDSIIIEV